MKDRMNKAQDQFYLDVYKRERFYEQPDMSDEERETVEFLNNIYRESDSFKEPPDEGKN